MGFSGLFQAIDMFAPDVGVIAPAKEFVLRLGKIVDLSNLPPIQISPSEDGLELSWFDLSRGMSLTFEFTVDDNTMHHYNPDGWDCKSLKNVSDQDILNEIKIMMHGTKWEF